MLSSASPFSGWSAAAPYAVALMLAALLCTLLAALGWRQRTKPGGPQFAAMMAAAAMWSLTYALESTAPTLASKVVFAKLEYVGIVTLPLTWFLFTRSYTGARKRLGRGLLAVLIAVPAVTLLLVATNEFHRLVWSEVSLSASGSFPSLMLTHGPWFWVYTVYAYGLLALGSFLLIRSVYRYPRLYREQAGLLVLATVAPWVGNAVFIFHLLPTGTVDPTPFAFTVTGLALALSMSRFRLFSLLPGLLPTARDQVLEEMSDGVLVVDVEGRLVTANPAAVRMLGQRASDLAGKPAREVLGDQVADLSGAETEESDGRFEITLGEGAGQRKYDVASSPVSRRAGVDLGRLLVLRDITERKEIEEQLEDEVFLRRLLVEQSRDGVVVLDRNGKVYEANQQYARMLGYSTEEVHQLHVWDWDTVFAKEQLLGMLEAVDDAGDHFETQHRRKDGSMCDVEISTNGVVYGGKKLIFCVCRDISERKRQEQALRESEERYRVLVDTTSDLIFSFDRDLHLTGINRAAADSLGLTVEAALGRPMADLGLPEATRRRWELTCHQTLAGGEIVDAVFSEVHMPDGVLHAIETDLWPIHGADDSVVGVRGVSRDVTSRRQAEEALLLAEEQLRQAQKMEAVGQLAGGIAHDFNNLLTSIIGNSSLVLATMSMEDPNREMLADIKDVGERAAGLTRQILAFSRRQVLKPEIVSLNQVVGGLQPLLARTLGENVHTSFVLAPGLHDTQVDPHQMEQVLMNLALNARDAMPEGGHLIVETANVELDRLYCRAHPGLESGSYVMLGVTDTGCGMDEKTKSHLFEPFFTTKEVGKGTGLGLSTVFGIVKQSGGSISVYSEPGKGTTFKVYLPVSQTTVAAETEPIDDLKMKSGSETVLVVEDEASVRELVIRILSRSGYKVMEAGSAEEVETALGKAGPVPDLLLTDVVLPGGASGRDVAERLLGRFPGLRVIFMSGYTQDSVVHNARLDEGFEFLEKPFALEALLGKVRAVLGAPITKARELAKSGSR